ncbi:Ankyrin-3-like isoform X3 [Oopsacas minuta]|uniref:Ankyrin-3-like isoform X3 n=1 Tax=Oopsacas minuta TaxID=111878 RepID=A0AAV7JM42_9METZ|nr:Ankyrin-3-like isoform X3 [Oopsacas minuta]
MTDSLDLQPLTSTIDVGVNEPQTNLDLPSICLCIVNDEAANLTDQLVIYNESLGAATEDHLLKVKPIEGGDVIEVKKQHTKILQNPEKSESDVDIFKHVHDLVKVQEPDALRLAISQGVLSTDTELSQSDGDSLLHYASRVGSAECLKYLLFEAITVFPFNSLNDEGFNILHSAVEGGKIENIDLLLNFLLKSEDEASSDLLKSHEDFLNAKTTTGNTALHLCSIFSKRDAIRPLLKAGVHLSEVDNNQNTLLHLAAEKSLIEFFKRIANYHITDRGDKSEALKELKECFLLQNKDKKIPVLLTDDRATIDIILKYSNVDAVVDKELGRLIHISAAEDNLILAEALIDKKIDLNIPNSKGFSPLKIAAKRGNVIVLEALLKAKANPNYIGKKLPGFSPLNNAAQFGQMGCVKLLIKHGADLVHKDMTNTIIHSAAYGGHAKVVEYLLKEVGMDVNQKNNANRTPLYQSITQGHNSVAKTLLHHGADPNVLLGKDSETLLHVAIREGRKDIVRMLLDAKAKPDEPLKNGVTPLMLAAERDFADYIPLIMAHGITLAKKDGEGNTVLHHIAKHNSCASARYILRRIGLMKGISQEFQLYKNGNNTKQTPYDVALESRNEPVLKIFIGYAPKDYFRNNPKQIHNYFDSKLYDTLKEVINRSVTVNENKGEVSAQTSFFDSNDSGQYPDDPKFKPLKESLLHKLIDCQDQELKYHPLVSIIVDKKLRFYRWWYVISFFFYLFFLICLAYALVQASTVCDSNIWLYQNPADWVRGGCEIICLLYFIFFLFNEAVEFIIEWTQIYEENKDKCEESQLTIKYISDATSGGDKTCLSIFFVQWKNILGLFHKLDVKLKYFFSAFPEYFDGVYNFIDWLGIVSFIVLIFLRATSVYIQWSFAGLTFIFFSLSLFKYTRISPALGAYVSGVFKIFVIDIPRFFVIIFVILIAYIGGIHLAARQQPTSTQSICSNPPYQVCNNTQSEFFWFNRELTCLYDLRRPLLSGVIFMLDGGPGNHVEDILQDNFFFTIVYLGFSFTIIVVMLNILIAQLSETYGEIIKENTYHYKIALVVTLELKSNLAFWFGKRFRKFTAIESLIIPLSRWNTLKDDSPNRNVDQVALDTNKDLNKSTKMIEIEFEKATKTNEELNHKIDELTDNMSVIDDRLDSFEQKINKVIELLNK